MQQVYDISNHETKLQHTLDTINHKAKQNVSTARLTKVLCRELDAKDVPYHHSKQTLIRLKDVLIFLCPYDKAEEQFPRFVKLWEEEKHQKLFVIHLNAHIYKKDFRYWVRKCREHNVWFSYANGDNCSTIINTLYHYGLV